MEVDVAPLSVNRDPRESIAHCPRTPAGRADASTAPTPVVPPTWWASPPPPFGLAHVLARFSRLGVRPTFEGVGTTAPSNATRLRPWRCAGQSVRDPAGDAAGTQGSGLMGFPLAYLRAASRSPVIRSSHGTGLPLLSRRFAPGAATRNHSAIRSVVSASGTRRRKPDTDLRRYALLLRCVSGSLPVSPGSDRRGGRSPSASGPSGMPSALPWSWVP
jgi:hypothetical protein